MEETPKSVGFTPESARRIANATRIVERSYGITHGPRLTDSPLPPRFTGVLTSALAAATSYNAPATATVDVLYPEHGGDTMHVVGTVTVKNRFSNISVVSGALVFVEWVDDEYRVYAADCGVTNS